ncbi:hypothetical protein SAMN05878494_1838 [Bacillus cereus]|nr:hypothetical protein SAMN05878494_1838 [Bacillus cereus]
MFSPLEKQLLTELLKTRIPGISQAQIESSFQKGESAVLQAESTVHQSNNQSSDEFYYLPVVKDEKFKLKAGHSLGLPFLSSNTGIDIEVESGTQQTQNQECYYLPIVKDEKFKLKAGHSLGLPFLSSNTGIAIEVESGTQQTQNQECYYLPIVKGEKLKINTGIVTSTPFGSSNTGIAIDFEDNILKSACKALAKTVYTAAVAAARALDPASQIIALAAAEALYEKAKKQC